MTNENPSQTIGESSPAPAPVTRPTKVEPGAKVPEPSASCPRLVAFADVILVVLFLGLAFLLGAFPLKDADIYWHLRTGQLIRETGQVPRVDIFTYTREGAPWIDLHWLFQICVSWLHDHGGVVALNVAKCVVTCLAVLVLVMSRRREWPLWVMLLAWLPALLVLGGRMYVRPETLSLLYLSVFLAVLCRWDRLPWLVVLLPVIQMAWVNSHGLFVLGPIVLTFALMDAFCAVAIAWIRGNATLLARGRWWRIVGAGSLATFAACLINPYGLRGAVFPIELAGTMTNKVFSEGIAELWSIPFFIRQAGLNNLPLQLHFLTLTLGILSFLIPGSWWLGVGLRGSRLAANPSPGAKTSRAPATAKARKSRSREGASSSRKKTAKTSRQPVAAESGRSPAFGWLIPFRMFMFAAFSYLSFQATRNSHQFAAVAGTVTAWNFGEWAAALRRRRAERRNGEAPPPSLWSLLSPRLAAGAAVLAVAAWVGSGVFYRMTGEGRTISLGEEPLFFAHEAARFAGGPDMPERFLSFHNAHASLFEFYNGPSRKVFTDPRLEVAGVDLFQRYLELDSKLKSNTYGWQSDLDRIGRPVIMVDHENRNWANGATLLSDGRWRCVWFDPIVAVFVHESFDRAVRNYSVDFAARHFRPEPTRTSLPRADRTALAKAYRWYLAATPSHRTDLVWPLLWLGEDQCRTLIRDDPGSATAWSLLGQIEIRRDPAPPFPPSPRFRLPFDPVLDLSSVRATYAMRRALDVNPGDLTTLLGLADVFGRRGMHEAALEVLDRIDLLTKSHPARVQILQEVEPKRQYHRHGLGEPPRASWSNAAELDRLITTMLATGRAATAADVIDEAMPPERSSGEALDRAAALRLHLGEPARARTLWEHGVTTAPDPAIVVSRIAVTYLVEGDFEAARQSYGRALAVSPGLFEACYGLAVLEADAGNARDAFHLAQRAAAAAGDERLRNAAGLILRSVERFANGSDHQTASPPSGTHSGAANVGHG
jgi:tetratricopeptide (TPR) repeat protein